MKRGAERRRCAHYFVTNISRYAYDFLSYVSRINLKLFEAEQNKAEQSSLPMISDKPRVAFLRYPIFLTPRLDRIYRKRYKHT